MTTHTLTHPCAGRRRLRDAALSEWTKLWTVRSTWMCLAAAAALVALFAGIQGLAGQGQHSSGATEMSATSSAATGVMFMGQLAIITLATLIVAGEYSTSSIHTTLQCIPVRGRMLAAKNLVLAPVCVAAGVVIAGLGIVVGEVAMGASGEPIHSGAVVGLLLGTGAYLGLTAAIVVGIAAIVRSVAGTVCASALAIVMLPMMLGSLGVHALAAIAPYLPGGAGGALLGTADDAPYGTGAAIAILVAWAVVANLAGALVLRRRDA